MDNKAEFLTTLENWDLTELLAQSSPASTVLVAIEVQPRHSRTGLLEERGRWIHRIWNATLSKIPDVAGHRMMWSQLVFVCTGSDIQEVEAQFAEILQSCRDEELKSLCVLSHASGNAEAKLMEVDRMLEGISKERNFGDSERFQHWLRDGERLPA
ncbi:MAG TPA: hypothetical protein VF735_14200 [Pyrinomonadaceae bacterium]|jgi:hypothetical protein